MRQNMRIILLAIIVLYNFFVFESAYASSMEVPPDPIGNFSLPESQRPGAFYSFGSNIIAPGQVLARVTPNLFQETGRRFVGSASSILYGTSEKSSLLFTLPMTPSVTGGIGRHAGFGDVGLQGEYEVYKRSSSTDSQKGGVIAGFTVPSGTKGFSSDTFSYFIGGAFSHTWTNWIVFAAPGLLQFSGGSSDKRLGARTYYELGVGRNISSQPGEYIFAGFLEVNGQYDKQNPSIHPVTHNSGGSVLSDGNLLFISPSLFFSTKKWVLEAGVSVPITQYWLGTRKKVDYFIGTAIAYTFN